MAHNNTVLTQMGESIELARNKQEQETVLNEFYALTDEYNKFVSEFDKKIDRVLSRMEALVEDGR